MTASPDGPDVVRDGPRAPFDLDREPVAGREGDEQVAARVAARAARPGDPQPGSLGQTLALVGEERRIRGEDHDDRPAPGRRRRSLERLGLVVRTRDLVGPDLLADRNAIHAKPGTFAVVRLDERRDREPAVRGTEHSRRGPDPALELVADHARSAAHATLGDRAAVAESRAERRCSAFTWKPFRSFSRPSYVSPTTGSDHHALVRSRSSTEAATRASRTTPTLWVFVIATGPPSMPDSRTHSRPVNSPLPFRRWQPANTGSRHASVPRGDTTVTPVRTGPCADDERAVAGDERRVADADARDVRDGVEWPGRPRPIDEAEIAQTHPRMLAAHVADGVRRNGRRIIRW